MGYVRNKPHKLEFDDPAMAAELEVYARPMPLGLMLDLTSLMDGDGKIKGKDVVAKLDPILKEFADRLVSWTLEDELPDGTRVPVPATYEGAKSQDFDFGFELLMAWMNTGSDVSGPKGKSSSNGLPSLEGSIPMETLSPSPTS